MSDAKQSSHIRQANLSFKVRIFCSTENYLFKLVVCVQLLSSLSQRLVIDVNIKINIKK